MRGPGQLAWPVKGHSSCTAPLRVPVRVARPGGEQMTTQTPTHSSPMLTVASLEGIRVLLRRSLAPDLRPGYPLPGYAFNEQEDDPEHPQGARPQHETSQTQGDGPRSIGQPDSYGSAHNQEDDNGPEEPSLLLSARCPSIGRLWLVVQLCPRRPDPTPQEAARSRTAPRPPALDR